MTQLELHKKIEKFYKAGAEVADVGNARDLMPSGNNDAKKYFFAKADVTWLDWLWENGFLDKIEEKADDPAKLFYSLPELDYLERMAELAPDKVAKIMLDKETATKKEKFNPEVINRFLWIIDKLPAERIKLLIGKIKDEEWVRLMKNFRQSGIEFEKMIEKLVEAKEDRAILELAQALFTIKSQEEMAENKSSFSLDSPFYLSYLGDSGIFDALINIDEQFREEALKITTGSMAEIVKLAGPDKAKVFEFLDSYSLFDVDFFTLEIGSKHTRSEREEIKNLAATIKKLIEKTIGQKCGDVNEAKKLFNFINNLPSSRSMWRLRLFTLAQCPAVFKAELKEALFRLFEVENYYEIEGGAEYKKALRIAFTQLSEPDQREYVANVLKYFTKKAEQYPDQAWHKRTGWEILSSIAGYLKDAEPKKCEDAFGKKCDEKYEPTPASSGVRGGMVSHLSPVNLADFNIGEIAANLKSDWTPAKLREQFKDDDFLSPRGAEGLGEALKLDVKKRINDYLPDLNLFFDKKQIHPHYLYSALWGLEESFREKLQINLEQIDKILGLFEAIKDSSKNEPFEKKKGDDNSLEWLADWIGVHRVMTDVLLHIVEREIIRQQGWQERKEKILGIIEYLLTIKDSPSKEDETPEYGEPFNVAINSVRGRAFQVFTAYVQNDGEKLSGKSKEIFEKALGDESMAAHFVIGHYLATFYFRDKDYIVRLFPEIFPKDDPAKKDLYLASWEGYLTNTLYNKLFVALKDYYLAAINLNPENYTKRKYTKDLDEALAVHLALAFVHLGLEMKGDLLKQFWDEPNTKRHKEFISFVGKDCLSRTGKSEAKISHEELFIFWDWALKNVEPEALAGFGFWINQDKEVLNDKIVAEKMAMTIEKSGGNIEWEYALMKRLPVFAEKAAADTLKIVENYLLDSTKQNLIRNLDIHSMYRDEIKQALEIIFKNGDGEMKQKVTNLINTLIERGSSMFWGLKEIIKSNQINI